MTLESLDYWRLCDELTIAQAALLVVGIDPSGEDGAYCENWKPHERPPGYEATKAFISSALSRGVLKGTLQPHWKADFNGHDYEPIEGSVDINASKVDVESLASLLSARGIKNNFFLPETKRAPDYANPQSPFYAPDLAAAVAAWEAVTGDPELLRGKRAKQAMIAWMKKNGDRYGLLDDEGNPREKRMGEIATLANWDKSPGAARTPDSPPDN